MVKAHSVIIIVITFVTITSVNDVSITDAFIDWMSDDVTASHGDIGLLANITMRHSLSPHALLLLVHVVCYGRTVINIVHTTPLPSRNDAVWPLVYTTLTAI